MAVLSTIRDRWRYANEDDGAPVWMPAADLESKHYLHQSVNTGRNGMSQPVERGRASQKGVGVVGSVEMGRDRSACQGVACQIGVG